MDEIAGRNETARNRPEDRVPPGRDARAVEAWFAGAGLAVAVVERCPDDSCPECRNRLAPAA
jgi:hypothetical protein